VKMEQFRVALAGSLAEGVGDAKRLSKLIRKHDKGLEEADFSCPGHAKVQVWKKCSGSADLECNRLKLLAEGSVSEVNQVLPFKISSVALNKSGSLLIRLSRPAVYSRVISEIVAGGGIVLDQRDQLSTIRLENHELTRIEKTSEMSFFRCCQVRSMLTRMYKSVASDKDKLIRIGCSDERYLKFGEESVGLQVGAVVGANGKKLAQSLDCVYGSLHSEYTNIVNERETSSAMSTEQRAKNVHTMVTADLQFKLLSTTVSEPCVIDPYKKSKDASFALYNYARLVHLIRAHCEGEYPELRDVSEVDFSHLREEEEWEIMFNYVMPYREMLSNVVQEDRFCLHRVCQFVAGLSGAFSRYYNRFRVLKDPAASGVLPAVEAKVYLLTATAAVYRHAFVILDIDTVANM
jgi:hypothetical protein